MTKPDKYGCDCSIIEEEKVEKVRSRLPPTEALFDVAEFFKVFGDSTRTRILFALKHADLCVCDLAVLLDMTHSAISHQLKVLKKNRLVKSNRAGKLVYYSLDDDHILHIFNEALHHINEERNDIDD